MNLKTAKDIANKILGGIAKEAKAKGVDSSTINKVAGTAKTSNAAGKIAKFLEPLLITNAVDMILGNIPMVKELWAGVGQIDDFIMDNTVYRIPGIGEVTKKVQKSALNMLLPNTQKYAGHQRINDPKYYENTDMHQAWSIPFNFPDTDLLDYAGGILYGAVAVIDMVSNYLSDQYAIQSRTTQIYDLLKGIRGLSGKQPYSIGDLYYYHRNCEYLVNEYCRLKFSLRLAQVYSLTKSRMPVNLLSALGWDPDNFIANRSLYIGVLTDLANFITNNVPMYGVQIKRIYGLWEHLIPDSNDGKVALFYKVNLHWHTLVPQTNGTYTPYGDFFIQGSGLSGGTTIFDISQLTSTNMNYATYVANMLTFIKEINVNDQFNPIRADIIASFGKSSIWGDSKIGTVTDTKYDDLIGPFDELFLTQLQNATIMHGIGFTTAPYVHNPMLNNGIRMKMTLGAQNSDGSFPFPTVANGNNAPLVVDYKGSNNSGAAGTVRMPAFDGAASLGGNNPVFTESTIVIANKYQMKESEQLEIVQLLAFAESQSTGYDVNAQEDLLSIDFLTNSLAVDKVRVLYFDPITKQDSVKDMGSSAILITGDGVSATYMLNTMRIAQFWSQADYGPKISVKLYDFNLTDQGTSLLLDFNIMGSISKAAFKQAIRYGAYSLNAADIKITEAKKLNNIVNVYSMK